MFLLSVTSVTAEPVSRTITLPGGRKILELEPPYWQALTELAVREHMSLADIVALADQHRPPKRSLAAILRLIALIYYRSASTEAGHAVAGHGAHQFGTNT